MLFFDSPNTFVIVFSYSPKEVETFEIKTTIPRAIAKLMNVGLNPIIGYAIDVKIRGTSRNSGNSARDFPRKYASVRYKRLLCSRKNTGNSAQNT